MSVAISTVADLVVSVSVRSGSVPKTMTVRRHLKLSTNIYDGWPTIRNPIQSVLRFITVSQ